MKLHISQDLSLPEDVVTSTTVVYGGKGMGKTNLGSVIVEELTKARLRWCFLDPMGVAWGLRHSKDGAGRGVECVILGGAHGDIPIEPTSGSVVADFVVDESVNTIIDFSRRANGQMWSKGEKIKFVTDYTLRLFQRQGELVSGHRREPLLQILDEAARYIPQQIPHGAAQLAECVGAWEQVCEEGRNIGLGVMFLTQRSARMNKSVSELADVMFAFRTIGPNSLEAVMDWLGEHVEKTRVRDLAAKVRELNVGDALVVSPGWLRVEKIAHIRERETFDSSATPKPGERPKRVTGEAAKPDLAKYQARMAATIERAKADDPKELRKEVAALRSQLSRVQKAQPAPAVATKPVIDQRAIDRAVTVATKAYDTRLFAIQRAVERVATPARLLAEALASLQTIDFSPAPKANGNGHAGKGEMAPLAPRANSAPARPPVTPRATSRGPVEGVTRGGQKILNALAELEAIGVEQATRHQLGMVAGYNLTGGSGAQHIADLGAIGLLDLPDKGAVRLTDTGRAAADASDVPASLAELHERVLAKLSGGQRRIAEHLISIYPEAISRADLGEATGYNLTGGSGAQHVADLVTVGAARIPGSGKVVASDLLFPKGLD
jgi:hypothetical protein